MDTDMDKYLEKAAVLIEAKYEIFFYSLYLSCLMKKYFYIQILPYFFPYILPPEKLTSKIIFCLLYFISLKNRRKNFVYRVPVQTL